jgi:hypothetical protein
VVVGVANHRDATLINRRVVERRTVWQSFVREVIVFLFVRGLRINGNRLAASGPLRKMTEGARRDTCAALKLHAEAYSEICADWVVSNRKTTEETWPLLTEVGGRRRLFVE